MGLIKKTKSDPCKNPHTFWADRLDRVLIRVEIPGAEDVRVRVKDQKLSIASPPYILSLSLLAPIDESSSLWHLNREHGVLELELVKKTPCVWQKLTLDKPPTLKRDWEHWLDEEEEEEEWLKRIARETQQSNENEKQEKGSVDKLYKRAGKFGVVVGLSVFSLLLLAIVTFPLILKGIHSPAHGGRSKE